MPALSELFERIPDEYRPLTMWFWSGEIRPDEIRRQLDEFKAQGIAGAFICATWGFRDVPYLSPEYLRLVAFTAAEAKKRGLKLWLYDELNWPSGIAGGERSTPRRLICLRSPRESDWSFPSPAWITSWR